jgi:hypothetical protein
MGNVFSTLIPVSLGDTAQGIILTSVPNFDLLQHPIAASYVLYLLYLKSYFDATTAQTNSSEILPMSSLDGCFTNSLAASIEGLKEQKQALPVIFPIATGQKYKLHDPLNISDNALMLS